jgi:hypothetical protein
MYLICKSEHFVLTRAGAGRELVKNRPIEAIAAGTLPGLPAPRAGVLSIF